MPTARAGRARQTVPAHVEVDVPNMPTTVIPQGLARTVIWLLGLALLVVSLIGGVYVIFSYNKAAQREHDEQFAKAAKLENHERQDVLAITELSKQTNQSIMKLTEAINLQNTSAYRARQWNKAVNLSVQASVTDLIARTCLKDNANSKDPLVCDKELKAAAHAADDLRDQQKKAGEVTDVTERITIDPPTVVAPGSVGPAH